MDFQDEIKKQQELRKANISNSFESVRGTDIEKGKWRVGDIDPKYPNYFVAELKPNGSPVWKSKNKHSSHPALTGKKEEEEPKKKSVDPNTQKYMDKFSDEELEDKIKYHTDKADKVHAKIANDLKNELDKRKSQKVEEPKKEDSKNETDEVLESIIPEKEISMDSFLKKLGDELGLTGSEEDIIAKLLKKNSEILDRKILSKVTSGTNYSGAWSVPNPFSSSTFVLSESTEDDLKSKISKFSTQEKDRVKRQAVQQKNHNYQYQRPSHYTEQWKITTLKKVLKDFPKRAKSSHGTFGSSNHSYNIVKEK